MTESILDEIRASLLDVQREHCRALDQQNDELRIAHSERISFVQSVAEALGLDTATASDEAVLRTLHEQVASAAKARRAAQRDLGRIQRLNAQIVVVQARYNRLVHRLAGCVGYAMTDDIGDDASAICQIIGDRFESAAESPDHAELDQLRQSWDRLAETLTGDVSASEWCVYGAALSARWCLHSAARLQTLITGVCELAGIDQPRTTTRLSVDGLVTQLQKRLARVE